MVDQQDPALISELELIRDPDDKLRVLCARNPIVRQMVQGAVFAKISTHYDHSIAIWTFEDARRYPDRAHIQLLNHEGTQVGHLQANRSLASISDHIGSSIPCEIIDLAESRQELLERTLGLLCGQTYDIDCPNCSAGWCYYSGNIDSDDDVYFNCPNDGNCDDTSFYLAANYLAELWGTPRAVMEWRCTNPDCSRYEQEVFCTLTAKTCRTHERPVYLTSGCCDILQEIDHDWT